MTIRPAFFLCAALGLVAAGCGKSSDPGSPGAGGSSSPGASAPGTTAAKPARGPSDPAELRLKWTPGQRQQQRMAIQMKIETSGGPVPKPIKQDMAMNMESSLTAVGPREGGGTELEMVIGDSDMSMMMGDQEVMKFDSRGESLGGDNSAGDIFRAMVGSKLKYLLNASNRVEKVEGWQEVVKKVSAAGPAASRSVMAGMLTEDYFKQLADLGRGLPNRSVRPGETWSDQQELVMGPLGRMILDLNYKFKGWQQHDQQECAEVTFSGTITSKPGEAGASPMGKMTVEGGTTAGTYWFNPDAGRLTELAMQQDINMVIDLAGAGRPAPPGGAVGSTTLKSRMLQKSQLKFSPDPAK